MEFEETRLNSQGSWGFEGGPRFNEKIKLRPNGAEIRKKLWSAPRFEYVAPYDKVTEEIFQAVYDAFMALDGQHVGFRFKDWRDYQLSQQLIGVATGSSQTLQLVKTYGFGSRTRTREIYKPVTGQIQLRSGASYGASSPISHTGGSTNGLVTFTTTAAHNVYVDGEFDVPVRFDMDYLPWSFEDWQATTMSLRMLELKSLNLDLT